MKYKAHRNAGFIFAFLITLMLITFFVKDYILKGYLTVPLLIASSIGGVIGGILPDLDHPKSKVAHSLGIITKIISKILNLLFGHRGFTHTIWFNILVPSIFLFIGRNILMPMKIFYLSFVFGLSLGIFSHLFLDSLTAGKIRPFYPISKKSIGFQTFITKKIKKD